MDKKPRVQSPVWRWVSIAIAVAVALLAYSWPLGLAQPAQAVFAIMLFAGVLWFTEALPLWVTALLVPPLLVLFGGSSPTEAYAPFFDPIIALLLGGFVLAIAVQKHGLDKRMALLFVRAFGTRPGMYLLGLMAATAFLSFWISNTASSLLMIPIGLATVGACGLSRLKSNYCKSVVLGIGYAATIGGTGTLIGTPPNMIAARFLGENGLSLTFTDWMLYAVPIVAVMVLIAWALLSVMYRPEIRKVRVPALDARKKLSRDQKLTVLIAFLTAGLWLTEGLHGVHYSVVAMLPIAGYYLLNVLKKEDLKGVNWSVLILVGGGLALGSGIQAAGLDVVMASVLGGFLAGYGAFVTLFLVAMFAIVFTAFVANTAAAAILIPVVIPMASMLGIPPTTMAVLVGITVSFDFMVPVGTPPNAIAYGTGYIRVKDMLKAGILLSVIGALVAALFGAFIW
jgi:sodium-dependent dicarboxylate transporter 2/3/5